MNQDYKEISIAFKKDNERWNLELPELETDFGEFLLEGGFDYTFMKSYKQGKLQHIDFKTSHRMTTDGYIRYDKSGKYYEMDYEIMKSGNYNGLSSDDIELITRQCNIEFNFLHNKIANADFDYDEYEFFWSNDSPFSQWHKVNFQLNDVEYSSAEQFMMAKKAELFGDTEIKDQILSTNNVRKQKQLGRQIRNFNEEIWNNCKIKIVYIANNLKFTQNEKLKTKLMETKGKYIVEASPVDTIWGIGIGPDDPRRFNREKWRGQNLLGKILTQLREDMLKMKKYRT
jgi:ribA/ribD-fused uncharacterized protein